jgi:hypothetical protein
MLLGCAHMALVWSPELSCALPRPPPYLCVLLDLGIRSRAVEIAQTLPLPRLFTGEVNREDQTNRCLDKQSSPGGTGSGVFINRHHCQEALLRKSAKASMNKTCSQM